MFKINIIHILFFLIIICLLYTLLSDCICSKDYFSVGGQTMDAICMNTNSILNNCNQNTNSDDCEYIDGCHWLEAYLTSFVTYQTYKEEITTESVKENIGIYNSWYPTVGNTKQDIINDDNINKLGLRIYPNKEKINEIDDDTSLRVYSDIINHSDSDLMNNYYYYAYFDFDKIKYILVVIKDDKIETKEILPYDLNNFYKIKLESQPEPVELTEELMELLSISQLPITKDEQDTINMLPQCDENFFIQDNPNYYDYYNYGKSDGGSVNNESCCLSVRNLIYSKYISTHHNLLDEEDQNHNPLDEGDQIIQDNIYKYAQGCADNGHISRLNYEPIAASLVQGDESDKWTPRDWIYPGFPNVGQTMRGIVNTPAQALLGPAKVGICAVAVGLLGIGAVALRRGRNPNQPIPQSDVETGHRP